MILHFDGQSIQGREPLGDLEVRAGRSFWNAQEIEGEPLQVWRELNRRFSKYLQGGAIGFLSYDLARSIEPRAFAASPPDDLRIPDARLRFYKYLQVEPLQPRPTQAASLAWDEAEADSKYLQDVAAIIDYIARGDIYQANLTRRFERPFAHSARALFELLRTRHAAAMAACLEWDDLQIVSNSPERFFQVRGPKVRAEPIKGTIARGATAEDDARQREKLWLSEKDRAENVMIVDLLRNDLGRVCQAGTVRVPELWQVRTLPTLHHLVSVVEGELRVGCDGLDVLRAAFPCGSITGAPKIRAMQILDELEPVRRGAAMGAIGYAKFDGDADWNVAIRTVTIKNGRAFFHVGGGIVADSVAEDEWREVGLKARAIRAALRDLEL